MHSLFWERKNYNCYVVEECTWLELGEEKIWFVDWDEALCNAENSTSIWEDSSCDDKVVVVADIDERNGKVDASNCTSGNIHS